MEGRALTEGVRQLLNEPVNGSFMDYKTTYDFLYEGVQDFNIRTHFMTAFQTITPTGTNIYPLNANYGGLSLMDQYNQFLIQYTDSSGNAYTTTYMDYNTILIQADTSTQTQPQGFCVLDAPSTSFLTGTASVSGAVSTGECYLNDTTLSPFANTAIGDYVHNLTDGSDGVVIGVVSSSQILTALFNGNMNDWTVGDTYTVVPQTRYQIRFAQNISAGITITVPYIVKPDPVYSPYRTYRLPFQYAEAIINYAAWKYKYKDRQAQFGDMLYKHYELGVGRAAAEMRKAVPERSGMRVNMSKVNKRSTGTGSWSI